MRGDGPEKLNKLFREGPEKINMQLGRVHKKYLRFRSYTFCRVDNLSRESFKTVLQHFEGEYDFKKNYYVPGEGPEKICLDKGDSYLFRLYMKEHQPPFFLIND